MKKIPFVFLVFLPLLFFSCHRQTGELKARWYDTALYLIDHKYTQIKIAVVWSEKWENEDGSFSDLRINSSQAALEAYRNGIASDYFLGKEALDTSGGVIHPPQQGCYAGCFPGWGEYEDSVDAARLDAFQSMAGKSVAFVPFSVYFGRYVGKDLSPIAYNLAQIGNVYGAVPMMRLMPWGEPYWQPQYQPEFSLDSIISGRFDDFLSSVAEIVRNYGKPVMVTFGVEMNGNWFPWSGVFQGAGTTSLFGDPYVPDGPERFVAAFRHVVEIFRSHGASNAIWYFQPNNESFPAEGWNDISSYYPGDDYVDWVAFSFYGAQTPDEEWLDFQSRMDVIYNEMITDFPDKPLMLAEWGVIER